MHFVELISYPIYVHMSCIACYLYHIMTCSVSQYHHVLLCFNYILYHDDIHVLSGRGEEEEEKGRKKKRVDMRPLYMFGLDSPLPTASLHHGK